MLCSCLPRSVFTQCVRLLQDKRARKLTKKRVPHFLPSPSTFDVTRTLTKWFSALSSSVPFSAQNANWRNFLVSSKRAGGPVTKRIRRLASSFDYARMHIVYHEIIASLCTHLPPPSHFRPPSRVSPPRIGQTQSKQSKSD